MFCSLGNSTSYLGTNKAIMEEEDVIDKMYKIWGFFVLIGDEFILENEVGDLQTPI